MSDSYLRTLWLIFLIAYLAIVFLNPSNLPHLTDYDVYYTAGTKADLHKTVYDVPHQDKFKYSPATAILWGESFSQLPYEVSKIVWYVFSLFLWLLLFIYFYKKINKKMKINFIYYASIIVLFYSVSLRSELKMGNANIFAIGLLVWFFHLYYEKQRSIILLGFILAVAVSFKLYVLGIMPFLIFRKEIKIVLIFMIMFLLFNIIFTAIYHNSFSFALLENYKWLYTLTDASADLIKSRYNISIMGFLVNLGLKKDIFLYSIWSSLLALFLYIQYKVKNNGFYINLGLVLMGILYFTPITWSYWVVFSFPVCVYAIFSINEFSGDTKKYILYFLIVYLSWICTDNDGTFVLRLPMLGMLALSYLFYDVAKRRKEQDNILR